MIINGKKGIFLTIVTIYIMVQLLSFVSVYKDYAHQVDVDSVIYQKSYTLKSLMSSLARESFVIVGGESIDVRSNNSNTTYILDGNFGVSAAQVNTYLQQTSDVLDQTSLQDISFTDFQTITIIYRLSENHTSFSIGPNNFSMSVNTTSISRLIVNISTSFSISGIAEGWDTSGSRYVQLNVRDNQSTLHQQTFFIPFDESQPIDIDFTGSEFTLTFNAEIIGSNPSLFTIFTTATGGSYNVTGLEVTFANDVSPSWKFDNSFTATVDDATLYGLYLIR